MLNAASADAFFDAQCWAAILLPNGAELWPD